VISSLGYRVHTFDFVVDEFGLRTQCRGLVRNRNAGPAVITLSIFHGPVFSPNRPEKCVEIGSRVNVHREPVTYNMCLLYSTQYYIILILNARVYIYLHAQGVIQFSRSTLEERRGPIITFRNLKNIRWGFFPLLFFIFCFFRARGMGN